MNQNKSNKLI